jgi:hypothetical protein
VAKGFSLPVNLLIDWNFVGKGLEVLAGKNHGRAVDATSSSSGYINSWANTREFLQRTDG